MTSFAPLALGALLLVSQVGGEGTPPGVQGLQETPGVRVEVQGVRGEMRRNVRSGLAIAQLEPDAGATGARIRELHETAPDQIRRALEPFGHYRPEIRATLTRAPSGGWVARYRITPGAPVVLASVDLHVEGAGRGDPSFDAVLREQSIRPGSPFRHPAWERAKRALENRAAARGYLDAELVESRVVVDRDAYEARAVLRLRTGPRYRFGPVRFEGSELRESLLRRYVPFEAGDTLALGALLELQSRLSGAGYFRSVEVEPLEEEADSSLRVPVTVRLRPRSRDGYSFSVGYATDTGPRTSAGWNRRWFDERGHQAEARIEASLVRLGATGEYRIPVGRSSGDLVTLGAGAVGERFEDVSSRVLAARSSLSHLRGSWRETFSFSVQEEWSEIGDAESRSTLLLPGASWSLARADDPADPSRSLRVLFATRGTLEAIGSDLSFLQASLTLRGTRTVGSRGRLLGRLELAGTAVDALEDLPASFRYFAGGEGSVRGYAFRSLGPERADDGVVVGGRHLATGSVEYEHTLVGPFGVAVFGDAGNALEDFSDVTVRKGTGVGARWRSPVGPVRLDVAWALDRPGTPVRIHFSVGATL